MLLIFGFQLYLRMCIVSIVEYVWFCSENLLKKVRILSDFDAYSSSSIVANGFLSRIGSISLSNCIFLCSFVYWGKMGFYCCTKCSISLFSGLVSLFIVILLLLLFQEYKIVDKTLVY